MNYNASLSDSYFYFRNKASSHQKVKV